MNEFKVGQWVNLKGAPLGYTVPMLVVGLLPNGDEPRCEVMWYLEDLSLTSQIIEEMFLEDFKG